MTGGAAAEPIVVGFSGPPKSGKSNLSIDVARALDWGRASFGDHVRHVTRAGGLDPTDPANLLSVGAELVDHDCEGFCRKVLDAAGWVGRQSVVLDGVRHIKVVETIRHIIAPVGFYLIFVDAPAATRERRFREDSRVSSIPLSHIEAHSTSRDLDALRQMADLLVDGRSPPRHRNVVINEIRRWTQPGPSDRANSPRGVRPD